MAILTQNQGCQMVANQNINFRIFWALEWRMLVYFMVNWNILRSFGTSHRYCGHLIYFPHFGILYQEKPGNPALNTALDAQIFFMEIANFLSES
jgi:hypothetical protein